MKVATLYGEVDVSSKYCRRCKQEKLMSEFPLRNHTKDGERTTFNTCKDCKHSTSTTVKRLKKEYAHLKTNRCDCCEKTVEEITEIFGKFNALERYCKMSIIHLDHCHKTNRFRGWICHHCNTLLSRANDDIEVLKKAIVYLKRSTPTLKP